MPRWNSCNILDVNTGTHRLWHFDAKGDGFALNREYAAKAGDALTARPAVKSWSSLWLKKLNVAWLPPEDVFLKLIELPQSNFEETLSMVELQLEKISPIPVTQIVWTLHVLPRHAAPQADAPALQTVVVVIVERGIVEKFLGQLESREYQADRLELPVLDQLEFADARADGVWVYPSPISGQNGALVAWWLGGVLRDLSLVTLPPAGSAGENLQSQFARLAWAGELEGWLTGRPQWHLVADAVNAALWEGALRETVGETVTVVAPLPPAELAGRTARRAAAASERTSLLPAEFTTRYHQQFVDRLWLRGLMAAGVLYGLAVAAYFCALFCPIIGLDSKTTVLEQRVAAMGGSFTNALQLKARYEVLKDRQNLKYAALDCWQLIADRLPAGTSIQWLSFSDGRKISLRGSVPPADLNKIIDFNDSLRKATQKDGEPMFDPNDGDAFQEHTAGGQVVWSFALVLKHGEELVKK
jgi:hypothetical protein